MPTNNYVSGNDFDNLQREAFMRARQMYDNKPQTNAIPRTQKNIAQKNTRYSQNNSQTHQSEKQKIHTSNQNAKLNANTNTNTNTNSNTKPNESATAPKTEKVHKQPPDLLDIIMQDKDRSLIILLIILLKEEGADTALILALMYLVI